MTILLGSDAPIVYYMTLPILANDISPYRKFLIGFSGGLDSTVLLHQFKLLRDKESDIKIRAVHVHHGISPNSDNWAEHCSAICYKWKIPLVIKYVSVTGEKLGIEAQARKLRYVTFASTILPNEALVIAQHLDDQCETFLLALKRGSGPAGLSAMPERKKFFSTQLLRPLLNETRESLLIWAKTHSLCWIEDESNQDECYDRNFLRIHVIPLLNKRWPNISTSITRSALLCAEQESLLNELLADELETLISKEGALKIAPLVIISAPHRAALLRRWFSRQGALMPSRSMLNKIWKEVAQAREDTIPCIHLNNHDIRRFKGYLWRVKTQSSCKDMILLWNDISKPLILPKGMGKVLLKESGHISFPFPGAKVSVRFKTDDIVHIIGHHRGKKLRKIWKELNIPPWERTTIPLLFYNETLIAAAGKFITKDGWTENGIRFENEK